MVSVAVEGSSALCFRLGALWRVVVVDAVWLRLREEREEFSNMTIRVGWPRI